MTRIDQPKPFTALLVFVLSFLTLFSVAEVASGAWSPAASMSTGRYQPTATLLSDGRVLVAGGLTNSDGYTTSAEIYNPVTNTWSPAGSMSTGRYLPTATLLSDGRVLVAGGITNSGGITTSAEIYNPAANGWSPAGSMSTGRYTHTATLLSGGTVVVTGGNSDNSPSGYLASAEIYDPATDSWLAAGAMRTKRGYHTATLLSHGRLLVAGGFNGNPVATAEIYDPATNSWAAADSLGVPRYYHTATLLSDGTMLVTGGATTDDYLATAEIFDPASDSWSPTGSMSTHRYIHTATLLSDGRVLVTGGQKSGGILASAEIYDPAIDSWSPAGAMSTVRYAHTATVLSDGTVLVAGGTTNFSTLASAEIFTSDEPLDQEPANTSITSGPSGTIAVDSATFGWSGSDNATPLANLVYTYRLDPIEASFSAFASATTKTYTNLANGSYTFHVKAKDQAGNEDQSPATRNFLVYAIIPNITVTPTSFNFGAIALGKTSANQTMTVKNDGTVTLSIGAVGVGGTNADQFSKASDNCSKKNLAPGASCTVAARFKPTSNGAKTGTLTILSNDPDENPFNVPLSGIGGAGAGTPDVNVTPLSINFGNVKVKKVVEQTITVKNDGTADLTLAAITVGGANADQFDTGADKCSNKTLPLTASCTVNAKFKATSTGAKTATLIISSNDPDENPVNVTLSGTGTP